MADTSNSRVTFSLTRTPPASRGAFLDAPVLAVDGGLALEAEKGVVEGVDGTSRVLEVDGDGLGDALDGQVTGHSVLGVDGLLAVLGTVVLLIGMRSSVVVDMSSNMVDASSIPSAGARHAGASDQHAAVARWNNVSRREHRASPAARPGEGRERNEQRAEF
jgi:hypothetical protein